MNTDLMRQVLSEQLSENVFQAPVSILTMRPLNITNLNLASLGDDFIDGKYKLADTVSQSCQYIGFNPLLLELQLGDKCVPYKLVVNGKTAGGFVDIFKDLCSHYDIKLPFPAADSLLAQEFADIHAMDANYLQLQQSTPQIAEFTPAYYGRYDLGQQFTYTIEELIEEPDHLNACNQTAVWPWDLFTKAIDGITHLHAQYYHQTTKLAAVPWLQRSQSLVEWQRNVPVWVALSQACQRLRPDIMRPEIALIQMQSIEQLDSWFACFAESGKTIIHGDFNPRNLGFRWHNLEHKVCILDWECAREHVPQFDVMQFLLYSSQPHNVVARTQRLLQQARLHLNAVAAKQSLPQLSHLQNVTVARACVQEMLVSRIPLLTIIFHHFSAPFDYAKLLLENAYVLMTDDSWLSDK